MRLQLSILSLIGWVTAMHAKPVDYLKQIKPLLNSRCASCHGALSQKGKLRLDTATFIKKGGRHGPAITPGKSESSLLIDAVLGRDRRRMPPKDEGAALTPKQIALLKAWIDQGASAPKNEPIPEDPRKHWAFRKPIRPSPPKSELLAFNAIDQFLNEKLTQRGLKPRPQANKATLLRRVTLDLIGLPPTQQQLHQFLNDDSPNAYEKVVDRLLSSPQYGERWGRHWMDVWRYSDWYGRRNVSDVRNSAGQIWRWRDWIIRSLNRDHGYDRMIQEMLAADEICPEDYEAGVATGYLIRNYYSLNPNDWMRSNVEHVGKAFLALTFNCAHCHDHKYDPITHEDYFRFRAFFEPMYIRQDRVPGEADPGPFLDYKYGGSRKVQRLGSVRIFDKSPNAPTWFYTGGDERNRDKERGTISPGVPDFLAEPLPKITPIQLPPRAWYPGLRPEIQQTMLKEASTNLSRLSSIQARITADRARFEKANQAEISALIRLASRREREAALKNAKKPAAIKKAKAALADKKRDKRYTPLTPIYPKTSTGRRRALAQWITSRENPLTARVAINHLWMRHFHQPLVSSVYDFGRNGTKPTHPQLLDWLADELMSKNWSIKHIHRLIVTSAAYRRVSSVGDSKANVKRDAENKLLWRMNTGRMEHEALRDSLLFLAKKLDTKIGGQELENKQALTTFRRSLYYSVYPEQGGTSALGELFDAPNPLECYRRTRSIVPQQALAMTNSTMIHSASTALAIRLWSKSESDQRSFIVSAFEQILSRPPSSRELAICTGYLTRHASLAKSPARARESLIRALFNHNDFLTIR